MFSHFIKRQPQRIDGIQCPESSRERRILFCDWGFHGRAGPDGWTFTYVDDVELDPEEDLNWYSKVYPEKCGETLAKFASSQLKKNSHVKGSKGWKFVCLIEDGDKRSLPVQRRDRTPRTMLLFEREIACTCQGKQHPAHGRAGSCSKSDKVNDVGYEYAPSEYDIPTPPPQYRSRMSTLTTLHEETPV